MKTTAVIAIILLAAGAGTLIALSSVGGTTNSGFSVERILNDEAGEKRVRLAVQIAEIKSAFKPMVFRVIDIVPEGETPSLDAPSIEVSYSGNDHVEPRLWGHVSIEGKWDADAKVFYAAKISTQCPSHYEDKQGQEPKPIGVKTTPKP